MATMEGLIGLMNRIQRACTALGDHGGSDLPTLWESLPTIAVVGGQSSGKSSVLESIVGTDFLPRGSGIVTRRPLVLQLHQTDQGAQEYAEFLHLPNTRFSDFALVRQEIADETDRLTGRTKQISPVPIHLSIYSPKVVNLTLIDLPGLTKVAVEGQSESIVQDIENMVRSYVEKPNCIIVAISPANQDIATSDEIKLSKETDPTGERTFRVLKKLDLMDKGTNALDVLEGRAYRLQNPWVGIVNRSQADINRKVDMIAAREKEREYFESSHDYAHLASRMGSVYLAKLLSQHLESVIKARIPSITSLINKTIDELESELDTIGRAVACDPEAQLYAILELCRAFDRVFKEHLDGGRSGGDRIYGVFDHQLPAAFRKLPFDGYLSVQNVKKVVSETDGYQPHLIPTSKKEAEFALSAVDVANCALGDPLHYQITDIDGKVSMAQIRRVSGFIEKLQIWTLDYKVEQSWNHKLSIQLPSVYNRGPYVIHWDKIVMHDLFSNIYGYELMGQSFEIELSKMVKLLDFSPRWDKNMQSYMYVKSLVRLDAYKKAGIVRRPKRRDRWELQKPGGGLLMMTWDLGGLHGSGLGSSRISRWEECHRPACLALGFVMGCGPRRQEGYPVGLQKGQARAMERIEQNTHRLA